MVRAPIGTAQFSLDGMKSIVAILAIMASASGYAAPTADSLALETARLTFDGLGPLRVGTNIKVLQAKGAKLKMNNGGSNSCRQATLRSNPGVKLMFENPRLPSAESIREVSNG